MASKLKDYRTKLAKLKTMYGGKCVQCASTNNLEFDHIDPRFKSFTISEGWALAWDRVMREAAKCQLLCRPCHKEKTRLQMYGVREHGTYTMFKRGKCRCEPCRSAHRMYMSKYK